MCNKANEYFSWSQLWLTHVWDHGCAHIFGFLFVLFHCSARVRSFVRLMHSSSGRNEMKTKQCRRRGEKNATNFVLLFWFMILTGFECRRSQIHARSLWIRFCYANSTDLNQEEKKNEQKPIRRNFVFFFFFRCAFV